LLLYRLGGNFSIKYNHAAKLFELGRRNYFLSFFS
jgi:hypothetical protein